MDAQDEHGSKVTYDKVYEKRRRAPVVVFTTLGIVLIACALALVVYNLVYATSADERAADALVLVQDQIPPFPQDDYVSPSGNLASVAVNGKSFAGIIAIPSLDVRLPVQSRWTQEDADFSPAVYAWDYETSSLVVGGASYSGHFGRLADIAEGERVEFTDMSGRVRIFEAYTVAAVDSDDMQALAEACEGWPLALFTDSFSGAQRIVLCCRELSSDEVSR